MSDFSIIIVTWNALSHLQTFLPSVWEHSKDEAEIILADNYSSDGTVKWVSESFPEIKIVSLEKNFGYCGGNNRAAAKASNKYLLFLNNDATVAPGWLPPLRSLFESSSDIAAIQPKIMDWKEKNKFEYAGAAGGLVDRFGYPFCRGRIFDHLETDSGQYDKPYDISWASGAAFAIRKECFEETGGFDESFEFHMEEIDLCWKLWNRGYRICYCPDARVYHLGGGSLPPDSPRKLYYNYRNNLKMMRKNDFSSSHAPRLMIRLLLDYLSLLKPLAAFRFRECFSIIRAHAHFLRSLPALSKQRKNEREKKKSGKKAYPFLQPCSIVWQYYIRGRKTYGKLPSGRY